MRSTELITSNDMFLFTGNVYWRQQRNRHITAIVECVFYPLPLTQQWCTSHIISTLPAPWWGFRALAQIRVRNQPHATWVWGHLWPQPFRFPTSCPSLGGWPRDWKWRVPLAWTAMGPIQTIKGPLLKMKTKNVHLRRRLQWNIFPEGRLRRGQCKIRIILKNPQEKRIGLNELYHRVCVSHIIQHQLQPWTTVVAGVMVTYTTILLIVSH